ncbi:serine hydrolase domain-containing protein [Chryseosolibacter indicus]|uniref:Beta-lactamase family protein n=1 Tax=Chryseosolibacter indicus TaxID=2782351 RepID=A0ABS5VNG2_9BACT|nr:serine hydrolase [Chryseosolibacter indicus]MBT1702973.1 beta-lactamase family protein [Chryseosolibacter indicus]
MLFYFLCLLTACKEEPIEPAGEQVGIEDPQDSTDDDTISIGKLDYYPPASDSTWESVTIQSLGWNADSLNQLLEFVEKKNTYGFIILYKGRIAVERYWNNWNKDTKSPIASAGKSITAFLTGIAQEEGLIDINKKTSEYLGEGWTSAPLEKENIITLKHQLSMTAGLDEAGDQCITPECLKYKADAGTRWAYHNGSYNLLNRVIEKTSGVTIDEYTKTRLADKIGMQYWGWASNNIIALSTRDMARFGLLILNKGKWNGSPLLSDSTYFNSMLNTSNEFNQSYGYLWWLNGKATYIVPENGEVIVNGPLTPTAPNDMVAAMGKGDKKIYVIPSLHMVVVRHGDDTGESTFGPSSFDADLWQRLEGVIKHH